MHDFTALLRSCMPRAWKRFKDSKGPAPIQPEWSYLEIGRIRAKIGENGIEHSEPLRPKDLQVIAAIIQIYNHIDFNLHRCIDIFTFAGLIENTAKRIPTSRLTAVVLDGVSQIDDPVHWTEIFQQIDLYRGDRNLYAHWAARRVQGEEALLILNKRSDDEIKRFNQKTDVHHSTYGLMLVRDLKWLVHRTGQLDKALGEATSKWYRQVVAPGEATPSKGAVSIPPRHLDSSEDGKQ